jgi:hypothetical protein
MFYTGIGSRKTPADILLIMSNLASRLEDRGYILRSGGAEGADTAFFNGVKNKRNCEVYIPWPGFANFHMLYQIPDKAFETAATVHPAWDKLPQSVQKLHARNIMQILGKDLNSPSSFVVCYTADKCVDENTRSYKTGGTATAIVLAARNNIPVFNLSIPEHLNRIKTFLN